MYIGFMWLELTVNKFMYLFYNELPAASTLCDGLAVQATHGMKNIFKKYTV